MNVIVIDDEAKSRQAVKQVLTHYCEGIEVLAEAGSLAEGKKAIEAHKPNAIFLDIEMPDGTGFTLLKSFPKIDFHVVFVTAYDHYAIQAIKSCAVDYLLKPIQIGEVQEAVEKLRSLTKTDVISGKLEILEKLLLKDKSQEKKIPVPVQNGIEFYLISQIVLCQAEGSYTQISFENGKEVLSSKNLKEFELILNPYGFLRVHHKSLINLRHVTKYIKGSGGYAVMSTRAEVNISRRKKEEFLVQLEGFS